MWKVNRRSDGRMDDGQIAIRKARLNFQLRWAKKTDYTLQKDQKALESYSRKRYITLGRKFRRAQPIHVFYFALYRQFCLDHRRKPREE